MGGVEGWVDEPVSIMVVEHIGVLRGRIIALNIY